MDVVPAAVWPWASHLTMLICIRILKGKINADDENVSRSLFSFKLFKFYMKVEFDLRVLDDQEGRFL